MVKYFNLNGRNLEGNGFDTITDAFSIEVNYPTDGSADVPLNGNKVSLREDVETHLRSKGYIPEEEFKAAISRDESLVYRTYRTFRANAKEVEVMLTGKKIKRCDVKLAGRDQVNRWADSVIIGLPTEKHHKVLALSLEKLGYSEIVPADIS